MRYSGRLGGGTPTVLKYQVGETMSTAGIPVEVASASQEGLQMVETTTGILIIGVTYDTATVVAGQQSDGSDTERQVTVVVNPDAIFRAMLSGGATSGTALSEGTEDTGSTDGLLVSTNVSYTSPSFDEGCLIGTSGANQGYVRKITSLSGADGVPTVAFPSDIAIGDKFVVLPFAFSGKIGGHITALDRQFVELTTTLEQINASVAVDTDNANFVPLRLILPADNRVTTQSYIDLLTYDHLYGNGNQ